MLHSSDSKALLAKGSRRERIVVVDRFDVAWLDNRRLPIDYGGAKTRRKDYALPWFLKRAIEKAGASCRPSVKLRAVWWFFLLLRRIRYMRIKDVLLLQMKTSRLYQHKAHLRRIRLCSSSAALSTNHCGFVSNYRVSSFFPWIPPSSTPQPIWRKTKAGSFSMSSLLLPFSKQSSWYCSSRRAQWTRLQMAGTCISWYQAISIALATSLSHHVCLRPVYRTLRCVKDFLLPSIVDWLTGFCSDASIRWRRTPHGRAGPSRRDQVD